VEIMESASRHSLFSLRLKFERDGVDSARLASTIFSKGCWPIGFNLFPWRRLWQRPSLGAVGLGRGLAYSTAFGRSFLVVVPQISLRCVGAIFEQIFLLCNLGLCVRVEAAFRHFACIARAGESKIGAESIWREF
jgi:hypothetical protein